jgi:GPH family glycoside/pentoside/hexuronide:cation symporter
MSTPSETSPDPKSADPESAHEHLPVSEKIAFGAGEFANRYGENGVNDIAIPVYNIILGVNPALVGTVLGAMRLWDAVTDPIMGYVSDNWRGKWGRRKPFLLIGSLLMAIAYPLIWMASPEWTENAKAIYLFCMSIIFFTSYTVYSVSFRALATEMTPDYEERTTIRTYSAFFNKVFMLMLPWIFPIAQMNFFPDPVFGIRFMAALSSILILVSGAICAYFPKERYHRVGVMQEKVPLVKSFVSLVKEPKFLILHGVGLGLLSSILLVMTFGNYVNMFYVWQGDTIMGSSYFAVSLNILQVLGFLMLFVIARFLVGVEKKKMILIALCCALAGSLARWVTFNQGIPWLIFLDPFFFAPAYTVFWAVWLSMLGDYCDYDEYLNGKRREGIFSAISGWIMKAGSSLAVAGSGILLVWTQFDKALGGSQPEGTLFKMRLILVFLPAACLVGAIVLNFVYPLSKARMADIRHALEERRGKV